MDYELSVQAWRRLREMKKQGIDAGKIYTRIINTLETLPEIPVILRAGKKKFLIPVGQWVLVVRETETGKITVLDIVRRNYH